MEVLNNKQLNVAIVGATGYTGELLIRLVAGHPRMRLNTVTSRAAAGQPVASVIPRLRGRVSPDLTFTNSDAQSLAEQTDLDLVFLALPHGVAAEFALALKAAGILTIDLSADFRLNSAELYEEWYGHQHPAPDLLSETPYVLPELSDPQWKQHRLIACPGCYPSSILFPMLPILKAGLHSGKGIISNSLSGVSGAGKKAAELYLFCERQESVKAYGVARHRHLSEIEEQLAIAVGHSVTLQFTPHLVPLRQGIHSTIVVPKETNSVADWYSIWNEMYDGKPFVKVLPSGQFPDTREVMETNRVDFSAVEDPRTGNIIVTSVIDNLWKGAAGQAIQIANLYHDWPETLGLS